MIRSQSIWPYLHWWGVIWKNSGVMMDHWQHHRVLRMSFGPSFDDLFYIFNYEFESFRDDLFFESYRDPQPLYDRKVCRSFLEEIISPIPDQRCCKGSKSEIFFPLILIMFFFHYFTRQTFLSFLLDFCSIFIIISNTSSIFFPLLSSTIFPFF